MYSLSYCSAVRKPGSALLLTLLMLTAISLIVVASARFAIEATRTANSLDSAEAASRIAHAGLEEGLKRISVGGLALDTNGEYGTSTPGVAAPRVRGFATGSSLPCSQLAPALADGTVNYDPGCPYYSLVIQKYITAAVDETILSDGDLPLNKAVTINFGNPTGNAGQGLKLNGTGATVNCSGSCGGFSTYTSGMTIYIPTDGSPLTLTRTSATLGTSGITVAGAGQNMLIYRSGYTCVGAVGTVGGVQKSLRLMLDSGPPASMSELEGATCADRK